MKKAKTPLLRLLQHSMMNAFMNQKEVHQIPSRRKFIKQSVLGIGAITMGSAWLESCTSNHKRIVILGAGVAGLHAAYLLKEKGIPFSLYEASKRAGGRMYSQSNLMGEGIVTELGAEFIDSNHEDILHLAKTFQLPLLDTEKDISLEKYIYYFENKKYTCQDLIKALAPFAESIKKDIDTLPEVIRYDNYGNIKAWDEMSIIDYLKSKGINGWLLSLFNIAFTTEYGLEASEQSAINMLFLLDTTMPGCSLFGESDERYKIVGGNQRITDELAKRVGDIHFEHAVTKIVDANEGAYSIHFANGQMVEADYIICTIPFSILRSIELSLKAMSPTKKQCISELGYGRNAKTFAGYDKSVWREKGYLGQTFTDKNFQLGWEHSQLQNTTSFGYTFFTGGTESDVMKEVTLEDKLKKYTSQLEEVFKGSQQALNGKQAQFYWPSYPFAKASYACYKVGQWTKFAGAESETIGHILFAGEHCSYNYQGYMNGGAETGRVAAENLLLLLKK